MGEERGRETEAKRERCRETERHTDYVNACVLWGGGNGSGENPLPAFQKGKANSRHPVKITSGPLALVSGNVLYSHGPFLL